MLASHVKIYNSWHPQNPLKLASRMARPPPRTVFFICILSREAGCSPEGPPFAHLASRMAQTTSRDIFKKILFPGRWSPEGPPFDPLASRMARPPPWTVCFKFAPGRWSPEGPPFWGKNQLKTENCNSGHRSSTFVKSKNKNSTQTKTQPTANATNAKPFVIELLHNTL